MSNPDARACRIKNATITRFPGEPAAVVAGVQALDEAIEALDGPPPALASGNNEWMDAAWRTWAELPHHAKLVLLLMAQLAKEIDGAPVYQSGWIPLANALGETGSGSYDNGDWTRRAQRKVDRALRTLKDAGALTLIAKSRPGRCTAYRLNLSRTEP